MSRLLISMLLGFALQVGCTSQDLESSSQALSTDSLSTDSRLVHAQRVWAGPQGGDGAPRYTLAWEHPDGTRSPAGVGVVTHAREWMGGALYVDADRTLRWEGEIVANDVVDAPAISPDGARFAYVVVEEDAGTRAALHVSDGSTDEVWDRSRLSLGALRFSPDGSAVLAVGSVNGGVAGLHVVDSRGARCLTNCDLRVGEPWDRFVVPPGSASALTFDDDRVSFETPQGVVTEAWR